jgi:putative flippase GtrA
MRNVQKESVYKRLSSHLINHDLHVLISSRFIRFCAVGFTGVVVNLGCLFILHRMGVHVNIASIAAIEASILSNFLLNHFWTFQDRRAESRGVLGVALRFHMVSLVGGSIQFFSFVIMNIVWFLVVFNTETRSLFFTGKSGWSNGWLWHAFIDPPHVGGYTYISQLIGVEIAVIWNYVINNLWTWAPDGRLSHERGLISRSGRLGLRADL